MFLTGNLGELSALLTAFLWTATAMSFEIASKRVGSFPVNFFRLYIAFFLYCGYTLVRFGTIMPMHASAESWFWLSLSGLVGFVFGDYFLFRAFISVGARISMLLMATVPPFTAVLGWIFLDEQLTLTDGIGMAVTMSGICIVIFKRSDILGVRTTRVGISISKKGLIFGIFGALGQSAGLIMSKYGMGQQDPFSSSQIRVLAGMAGYTVLYALLNKWKNLPLTFRDKKAMKYILTGSVFGPFLGVGFSLAAVQLANAAVASTIMALTPVLILLPSYLIYKERITLREIAGTVLAVAGVTLLFLV